MELTLEYFDSDSSEDGIRDESIGKIETKISGIKLINDLKVLDSIKSYNDLGLLISRNWSPEGENIYKKILAGEMAFPFFKEAEPITIVTGLYLYELTPIDNFSYYIKIGIEDILKDQDLFNYVIFALPILFNKISWEGDFRDSLYICITPGLEKIPILVVKQDNNGTTFLISQVKLEWLEEEIVHDKKFPFYRKKQYLRIV